jgi:hypothetical protein
MRKSLLAFVLVILVGQLFAAAALADKPPAGTLDLLNEPQSPGYAMFHVTWANQVKFPALWLICKQDGVSRYVAHREPIVGDGEATFSIGIPTGSVWWNVAGGPAVCTASLKSYKVFEKPYIRVDVEDLDELTFEVDVH